VIPTKRLCQFEDIVGPVEKAASWLPGGTAESRSVHRNDLDPGLSGGLVTKLCLKTASRKAVKVQHGLALGVAEAGKGEDPSVGEVDVFNRLG
jgi:hypothetical protein